MRYRLLGNSGLRVSEAALKTVSDEIGCSMAQVALAWLRYRPVPVMPIIGARKLSQLKDNLASFDLTLSANHLKTLEEASRIEFGFRTIFVPRRWSAPSSTAAYETRFWLSSGGSRAEKGCRRSYGTALETAKHLF
jgi:diketogulonate reductase-like aldo/keto reductase